MRHQNDKAWQRLALHRTMKGMLPKTYLVLSIHPFHIDFKVQLSHAADNGLTCLWI
jgi:hypothetical protein